MSMKKMPRMPESAILTWDEKKNQAKGGMDSGRKTLIDLLRDFSFYKREFEGDPALLERRVPGDWIKRDSARRVDVLAAFQNILNSQLDLAIRFVPHEVERDAFIAGGTFEFHLLGSEYANEQIHLFAEKPDPPDNIRGGGGSGDLDHFLDYVGRLGKIRIINENKSAAVENLIWRQHSSATSGPLQKDPALFEMLLKNVSQQTSLRFRKERRNERIWLVKSAG